MERTRAGNSKPPKDEIVCGWLSQAWTQIDSTVVLNSIAAAGLGNHDDWFISKHDSYGSRFRDCWNSRADFSNDLLEFRESEEHEEDFVID